MTPTAMPVTGLERHLADMIMLLAASARQCPLAEMVRALDDIRTGAARAGLNQVAVLASHLESAIGAYGRRAAIASYLDAMAAALDQPEDIDPRRADEAWAASVAVRFAN